LGAGEKSAAEPLGVEAQIKLRLMEIIDADLRARFRTVEEMAGYAQVEQRRIWNLRARSHDEFSLSWLLRLAQSANVHIRIDIYD
jgi:hypothetical protein